MNFWLSSLRYNPLEPLIHSQNAAIAFFAQRELLNQTNTPIQSIWRTPDVVRLLKRQLDDGSWRVSGKHAHSGPKYSLVETWKHLKLLVDQYQMSREHPAVEKAAEYVFSCQSDEGDIRGMLANQYMPYYTGAILYLLINAGYQNDKRIEKGMKWLISMRQNDGGWVIGSPGLINRSWKELCSLTSRWTPEPAKEFDWSKPFSAAGTGMVLRAFSVHPKYKKSPECLKAASLLKSKFFKPDNWSWYRHQDHWVRFQFPFWWTNIVSALDTLSLVGFSKDDPDIKTALEWLIDNQQKDGLWKESYSRIHKSTNNNKSAEVRLWISLSICRIVKRFYQTF
jgi:hypothetical protein